MWFIGVGVYKLERSSTLTTNNSPWAIKKLLGGRSNNSIYGKRLRTEASLLKKLQHPNIVGYRGLLNDANGKECLAMEQCTNCLGELIETRAENSQPAFPAKNILKVAWDISNALNYLHNKALLLHGDMKSYNILIKDDFVICKLCDFGVSISLNADGTADLTKLKNTNISIGTAAWSAPEILKSPKQITSKSDIFSLALVFWEMLALQPPPIWEDENTSLDNSENDIDLPQRTSFRPDLPNEDFGPEYNYVLELFYCCSSEHLKQRPSAGDLILIVQDMIKEQKLDDLLQ